MTTAAQTPQAAARMAQVNKMVARVKRASAPKKKRPQANLMQASVMCVFCPLCGHRDIEVNKDPRGKTVECARCTREFDIPEDIDIHLY